MKVKELKEFLEECEQEAEVMVVVQKQLLTIYNEITSVEQTQDALSNVNIVEIAMQ